MTYEENKNKVISHIEQSKVDYGKISEKYIKDACGGNFYEVTFFVLGIINRQIEILDGIMYAVNVKNLNVGGGLLRMLFENFYFFFYVYGFTPNLDINRLQRFNKDGKLSIIDEKGKQVMVKEIDMVNNLLKIYPQFENIYKETSKFIHFSNKHLYNFIENTKLYGTKKYLSMKIGLGNEYWAKGEEFNKVLA